MSNKKLSNEAANPSLRKGVVGSSASFPEAFERFKNFESVKVAKNLKHEFHEYITDQILENGIWFWSGESIPMATCYKFKRTS